MFKHSTTATKNNKKWWDESDRIISLVQQLKEKICRNYNITSVKLLYFYKIGVNSNINLNLNLKIKAGLLNIKHCITHLMVTDGMSGKDGAAYRQIFCKVLNENITFIPIPFLSTVKKKRWKFSVYYNLLLPATCFQRSFKQVLWN